MMCRRRLALVGLGILVGSVVWVFLQLLFDLPPLRGPYGRPLYGYGRFSTGYGPPRDAVKMFSSVVASTLLLLLSVGGCTLVVRLLRRLNDTPRVLVSALGQIVAAIGGMCGVFLCYKQLIYTVMEFLVRKQLLIGNCVVYGYPKCPVKDLPQATTWTYERWHPMTHLDGWGQGVVIVSHVAAASIGGVLLLFIVMVLIPAASLSRVEDEKDGAGAE